MNLDGHSSVTRKSYQSTWPEFPSEKKQSWDFVYVLMRSDAQNLTSMGTLRREKNSDGGKSEENNPLNLGVFKKS